MPVGRTWRHILSSDILFLMTGGAFLAVQPLSIRSSSYVLRVNMVVIALPGIVTCRVAIQTAWMFEDRNDRDKKFAGASVVFLRGVARGSRDWLSNEAERDYQEDADQEFQM